MTVHNFNNGPSTWSILLCIDLRASSWFNVRVFIIYYKRFLYLCINSRCPFDIIGNRFFTEYFFPLYPFPVYDESCISVRTLRSLDLSDEVSISRLAILLGYGVKASSNCLFKFVLLGWTSVPRTVKLCCWFCILHLRYNRDWFVGFPTKEKVGKHTHLK